MFAFASGWMLHMGLTGRIPGVEGHAPRVRLFGIPLAHWVSPAIPPAAPLRHENSLSIRWWFWWNILSLDAPTVAIVWALIYAKAAGITLLVSELVVLALTVWIIYVTDRMLDGLKCRDMSMLHERHRFCARHRFLLSALLVSACLGVLCIATMYMDAPERDAGFKLALCVAVYLLWIHAAGARLARLLPKEIVVGMLFAAGATLPVWSRLSTASSKLFISFGLLALLCALNCVVIECWEHDAPRGSRLAGANPLVVWAEPRLKTLALGLAICGLAALFAFGFHGASWPASLALFLSASATLLLLYCKNSLSSAALRVLADTALVLPALLVILLGG
jgi:hypothetical protein